VADIALEAQAHFATHTESSSTGKSLRDAQHLALVNQTKASLSSVAPGRETICLLSGKDICCALQESVIQTVRCATHAQGSCVGVAVQFAGQLSTAPATQGISIR
jgi:hypothetical protein